MTDKEIIQKAGILHAQITKGVIVIPEITSFLSRISQPENKPKRKSKKQTEEEAINAMIIRMNSRKKAVK